MPAGQLQVKRAFIFFSLVGSLLFLWACGDGPTGSSSGGGASIPPPETAAKSFVSIGLVAQTEKGLEYLPSDPEQAKEFLR